MTTSPDLLGQFIRQYPFQPATAYWRAIEIGHVVAFPFPDGKGLDLGCGDGKLTRILGERIGWRRWVGIDLDASETELARQTGLYESVHTGSANQVPEPAGAFDFVFSNSVLEHIPDLAGTIREVSRVLKTGGAFLFTVPSHEFHACLWGPLLPGQDRAAYLTNLDKRCAHLRYLSSEQWAGALSDAGLEVARVTRYLNVAQTRRWKNISRMTAGILFAAFGKRKQPIEIQKSLGLRRRTVRIPTPVSRLLAMAASFGAAPQPNVVPDGAGDAGCLMVLARKP